MSLLERAFKGAKLPELVTEYRFHPQRKWRFDYAIPKLKIAIEQEGGAWIAGRHNRASGFLKDLEKYNEATVLGWRVLRYTPDNIHLAISDVENLLKYLNGKESKKSLKGKAKRPTGKSASGSPLKKEPPRPEA